jgi:hypothetical protein
MNDLPLMLVTLVLALAALMGCMALLNWCVEKSPSAILIRYASFAESGLSLVAACASAFTMMSHL